MRHSTKVRFILVGLLNTAVDFGIFTVLIVMAGLSAVAASVVSTSVAMVLSYIFNRSFVFKQKRPPHGKEALQFFAVTLVGLWIVQSVVIAQVAGFLHGVLFAVPLWEADDLAKVLAIGASTIWNYLWYSRLVFVKKGKQHG